MKAYRGLESMFVPYQIAGSKYRSAGVCKAAADRAPDCDRRVGQLGSNVGWRRPRAAPAMSASTVTHPD